jgi:superfamily II DNA or RNA helicase
MNKICEFTWFDGFLIIKNPTKKMEKFLFWDKKSLVLDKRTYTRKSEVEKIQLYNVFKEGDGPDKEGRTIQTMQGFKDQLIVICKNEGVEWKLIDNRIPFVKPMMGCAGGFRFEQETLFKDFIEANQSGLLQAPTRYGKSIMIKNVCKVFPTLKTVVAAPGVDLLGQTVKDLQESLPEREVKGIFTGSRNREQSHDITVCSLDSLHKMDSEGTKLLLIDEPHAAVSETRAPVLARFKNSRIYGFGATVTGRYDNADKLLTGLVGPVLVRRTFQEAVDEGAICGIRVYMVRFPFQRFSCSKRDVAYKRLVYENAAFIDMVKSVSNSVIPQDWQTIVFIDQQKQADLVAQNIEHGHVVVAGRMKVKERRETFTNMVNDNIKRCVCTDVYAQGVTFPDVRVMINASGGGGSISSTQKPGRLAQIRPNKQRGYLVDFLFECEDAPPSDNSAWRMVVRDSRARLKLYASLGYEIHIVDSLAEISNSMD